MSAIMPGRTATLSTVVAILTPPYLRATGLVASALTASSSASSMAVGTRTYGNSFNLSEVRPSIMALMRSMMQSSANSPTAYHSEYGTPSGPGSVSRDLDMAC